MNRITACSLIAASILTVCLLPVTVAGHQTTQQDKPDVPVSTSVYNTMRLKPPTVPAGIKLVPVKFTPEPNPPAQHPNPPKRDFSVMPTQRGQSTSAYSPPMGWTSYGGFYYFHDYTSGQYFARTNYCPTEWMHFGSGCWYKIGSGYFFHPPKLQSHQSFTAVVEETVTVQLTDPYTGAVRSQIMKVQFYYNVLWYAKEQKYGYLDFQGKFRWISW